MNASQRIRTTRTYLLFALIAAVALAVVGLFIGLGVPGLVLSWVGWIAAVVIIVWLARSAFRRPAGPSQIWRPGDAGEGR